MTQEEKFYNEAKQSLTTFTIACAFIVIAFALAELLV